jgi:tetratricopeptide (TPR) repeat protein
MAETILFNSCSFEERIADGPGLFPGPKNLVALSLQIQQNSALRERTTVTGYEGERARSGFPMPTRLQRAALGAVLTLMVLGLAGCDRLRSRQEIKRGHEFLKAGQYDAALAAYQEALRLDPNEKKIYKSLGLAYMGRYQPGSKHPKDLEIAQKAIESLDTYVQAFPQDKKAREFLVSMYLATDRYEDAIKFYQEMLKTDPKDSKAMSSIAQMYFKKGDFDTAVVWLKKRLEVEGNNPEVYYLIGVQAWDRSYNFPDLAPDTRAKVVEEGMQALNKAVEIKPEYFEAISYINLLYREKAKMETDPAKKKEFTDAADKYLQQALELRRKAKEAEAAKGPTPEPAK